MLVHGDAPNRMLRMKMIMKMAMARMDDVTMRRRCDDDGDDEDEDRCMHFDLYVLSALGADSADFNKYTTAFNINGARFYIRQHLFCFGCFFFFVVVFVFFFCFVVFFVVVFVFFFVF